jgi:hypothetical protein
MPQPKRCGKKGMKKAKNKCKKDLAITRKVLY